MDKYPLLNKDQRIIRYYNHIQTFLKEYMQIGKKK